MKERAILADPTKALRAVACFREHSQFPGSFVGTIDGKAYVIHPSTNQDGSKGMLLLFNPVATELLEGAE